MPAPSIVLQVDKKTGETNELVVLLNYSNTAAIQKILPAQGNAEATAATSKPTGLERAFVAAVQSKDQKTTAAVQGAAHARFVLWTERMSDEDRVRGAEMNAPRELLERYIVLRYPSLGAAQAAQKQFERDKSLLATAKNNREAVTSWLPNDSYFSPPFGNTTLQSQYQWGMHAMNFPFAWDKVRGHAQVGILEVELPGTFVGSTLVPHTDILKNYRPQFVPGQTIFPYSLANVFDHAIHVSGIIGAQANNGSLASPASPTGVTGGCTDCSLTVFPFVNNTVTNPSSSFNSNAQQESAIATALSKAIDTGMQVINYSGSLKERLNCPDMAHIFCAALAYAKERDVLLVSATGNFSYSASELLSPNNLANDYFVLPVAGTEVFAPSITGLGARWTTSIIQTDQLGQNKFVGSSVATQYGVVGPAKNVVSTISANSMYSNPGGYIGDLSDPFKCADIFDTDLSGSRFPGGYGDAIGTCTGTSMAAPHVTALAGLVRSVNPRLDAAAIRQIIRESGNLTNQISTEMGHGLPNALTAVNTGIATNASKLAPLFSFYSAQRSDSFYTTVPQMANAAMDATLKPHTNGNYFGANGWYASAYGSAISGYWSFPRNPFVWGGAGAVSSPKAEVWIFTTHINPKSPSVDLEPLLRMSWKCGDDTPKGVAPGAYGSLAPAVCNGTPRHIDTVLVNQAELAYFDWLGYKVDGTEGYVYPKTLAQPAGTVRLMRKYNRARDDFAAFPDTALATMQSNGYTEDGNLTDWLGYVYPNTNGQTPVIQ